MKKELHCNYFNRLYLFKGTHQQFINHIKKEYDEDYYADETYGKTTVCQRNGVKIIYIWIEEELPLEKKLYVIFHEVGHALIDIFDIIGTEVKDESSEIFLHSQEDLVEQIIGHLNVKSKKKRKKLNYKKH